MAEPGLLTYAGIAALISTAGALLAMALKETVLARSFERWKNRVDLKNLQRAWTAHSRSRHFDPWASPSFVPHVSTSKEVQDQAGRLVSPAKLRLLASALAGLGARKTLTGCQPAGMYPAHFGAPRRDGARGAKRGWEYKGSTTALAACFSVC